MFEGVVIKDAQGNIRDEAWLRGRYGDIRIRKAGEGDGMRVVGLYENIGMANIQVMCLDEDDQPIHGALVARRWPYRDNNPALGELSPELQSWFEHGVEGKTEENGVIGFATGGGDFYSPPEVMGASTVWAEGLSDAVEGLGILREPGYPSMDVVLKWGGGPPPPPDEVRALILSAKAHLAAAQLDLDKALELLP